MLLNLLLLKNVCNLKIPQYIFGKENLYSLKECYEYIDEMVEKQEGFKELDLNLFKYKDIFIRKNYTIFLTL